MHSFSLVILMVLLTVIPYLNGLENGENARMVDYPWMVSVRNGNNKNEHLCGGTFIEKPGSASDELQYVATAAHCMCTDLRKGLPFNKNRQILYGTAKRTPASDDEFVEIEKGLCHEQWAKNLGSERKAPDLAVFKLKTPIKKSPTAQPLGLSCTRDDVAENSNCFASGWGYWIKNNEKDLAPLLQAGVFRLAIYDDTCKRENPILQPPKYICVKSQKEPRTVLRKHDSGGALACPQKGSSTGKKCFSGILSFSSIVRPIHSFVNVFHYQGDILDMLNKLP